MLWLLKCHPWSLSVQHGYLYMVLSFSSPLMVATWFAQRPENAWVRPGTVHTNQDIFWNFTLREGANIINLPVPHLLGTPVDVFGSCLGCCFKCTRHTIVALTRSLYFEGKSDILGNMPFYLGTSVTTFLCIQSAVSIEGSVARATQAGHQLSDCQGVSVLWTRT